MYYVWKLKPFFPYAAMLAMLGVGLNDTVASSERGSGVGVIARVHVFFFRGYQWVITAIAEHAVCLPAPTAVTLE